jgi:hypothetical protein
MISIEFLNFLIDWTFFNIQFSILSCTYPWNGVFRTDSLFAFAYTDKEFYLELFFVIIVGGKRYEY